MFLWAALPVHTMLHSSSDSAVTGSGYTRGRDLNYTPATSNECYRVAALITSLGRITLLATALVAASDSDE